MMQAAEISRTGLDVEWQRMQVIAQNLANMNSARVGEAGYQAMRLLSGPKVGFSQLLSGGSLQAMTGVAVLNVMPTNGGSRRVYEPQSPAADSDGYVSYPAVDHAAEMALMVKTARAYEANLTAMSVAHQMYARALDLGKRT